MRTMIWMTRLSKSLYEGVLLFLLAATVPIKGYSESNNNFSMNELRSNLNYMFAKINRDSVPTGLLRDYAIEYENLDNYDGSRGLTFNNICDVTSYAKILNTLKSASLFDNPFKSFEAEIKQSQSLSP